MHHLIYMSHATHSLDEQDLALLLQQARDGNEQRSITGVLVYGGGQFMQVLEGERTQVLALYEHLLNDPRHERVVKLADKEVEQRSFANWNMAFRSASPEQFAELAGYIEPSKVEVDVPGLSEADKLLLHMMKVFVLTPHS